MPRKPPVDRPLRWGDGYVTARPNGRWQARWHDGQRWRAQTVSSQEAAEELVRAAGRHRRAGTVRDLDDLTVADAAAGYLARIGTAVKPITRYNYGHDLAAHIIPALGPIRVRQLTTHRVQQWIDQMTRAGAAPSTIRQRVSVLAHVMNECVRLGVIAASPVTLTRKPKPAAAPPPVWTSAEAARVIAAAAAAGPMWHAVYLLALTTALRPGELCALRWTDFDADRRVLQIARTLTSDVAGHRIVGTSTKTSRSRAVALTPAVVTALQTWRVSDPMPRIEGFIFHGQRTANLITSSLSHQHRRIVTAARVPYIKPHGMRHTCATLLLARGVHLKVVADLLGHTNIATTANIYMHTDVSMQRTALDALTDSLTKTS